MTHFQELTGRELLWADEKLRQLLAWRHGKARCDADPEAFNGILLEDLRAGDRAFDEIAETESQEAAA